ncbi:MAG: chemotaxis protein CheW [Gammaproteobacteria bacterium]
MSDPVVQQQDIYSLLVPLSEHRLLVPRANIAEVTGHRECKSIDGAPPWLLGTFAWEKEIIPLISFEGAMGHATPETNARTRIVLLRTLGDALKVPCFGVVTHGFPQLVRVNSMVVTRDESNEWPAEGPVLCQLRMVNQTPLVPDIEYLEQQIAAAWSASTR